MDLNLHHRTCIILGGPGPTQQSLIQSLTSQGCDVVLLGPDAEKLQKFCQTISDQREINPKFGRAGALGLMDLSAESLKDGIGRASQVFGGLDIFIDALMTQKPTPFKIGDEINDIEGVIRDNLTTTLRATEFVSGFFKSRKKGRIIYLLNESFNKGLSVDALATAARTGLIAFCKTLSRQLQEYTITVNCLSLGLTEEYLAGHFPESTSLKQSAEMMKVFDPSFRITDSEKISQAILFLVSSAGVSVTGQHLTLS